MNFSEWLSKALSETNGSPSSLRVAFWAWEAAILFCFVGVVSYAAWSHFHDPAHVYDPVNILGVLLAALGINRGSKQFQKQTENNTPLAPPTP